MFKGTRYLAAFLFILFSSAVAQQKANLDSLKALLETTSEPEKGKVYNQLSVAYYSVDIDLSLWYAKQGLALGEQLNDVWLQAALSNSLGGIYMRKGNFDSAGYFYQRSYQFNVQAGDSSGIGKALSGLSNYLSRKGMYDSSIVILNESISILKQTNDSLGLAIAYVNLGNRYGSKGDLTKALANQHRSLALFEKLGEISRAQNVHIAIGNAYNHMSVEEKAIDHYQKALYDYPNPLSVYDQAVVSNNIGSLMLKKLRFKEAKPYLNKAFEIWGGDPKNCYSIYPAVNLSEVYLELDDLDSAEYFLNLAIHKAETCKEESIVAAALVVKGKVKMKRSLPSEAMKLLNQAHGMAMRMGRKDLQRDAAFALYGYHKDQGNFRKALEFFETFKIIADSIVNQDNTRKMATMEATFEFEKEKQQLESVHEQEVLREQEKLKKQTMLTNLYLAGAGVLIIILFLLYRSYAIKQKANKSLAEKNKEILRQKSELEVMNQTKEKLLSVLSHDLKNPLFGLEGSLHMFLEGAMTQERLQQYVRDLQIRLHNTSDFLENLLEWTKGQLAGIHPNRSVFKAKRLVEDTINLLEPAAKAKNILIIPVVSSELSLYADYEMTKVVLRNLVTNAIKFSPEGESITVSIAEMDSEHIISVHDNGAGIEGKTSKELFSVIGFTKRGTRGETGNGLGLVLSHEFVEKQGGRIWFENKEDRGTSFYFSVPVKEAVTA